MKSVCKIRLRPVERADVEFLYHWNASEFLGKWQSIEIQSISRYVKRFENGGFNCDNFQFFVIMRGNVRCGICIVHFNSPFVANVGITLAPSCRGLGICRQALQKVIDYIFENRLIERIEADTDEKNDSGIAALENFGFLREGILRHNRFHHGQFHNSIMFSYLRSDWERELSKGHK